MTPGTSCEQGRLQAKALSKRNRCRWEPSIILPARTRFPISLPSQIPFALLHGNLAAPQTLPQQYRGAGCLFPKDTDCNRRTSTSPWRIRNETIFVYRTCIPCIYTCKYFKNISIPPKAPLKWDSCLPHTYLCNCLNVTEQHTFPVLHHTLFSQENSPQLGSQVSRWEHGITRKTSDEGETRLLLPLRCPVKDIGKAFLDTTVQS